MSEFWCPIGKSKEECDPSECIEGEEIECEEWIKLELERWAHEDEHWEGLGENEE